MTLSSLLISEGPFQSDALLVPEHCVFDHVHEAKACRTVIQWNETSTSSCRNKKLFQQSFAMLLPCGIDMFSGVEFVCCPGAADGKLTTLRHGHET